MLTYEHWQTRGARSRRLLLTPVIVIVNVAICSVVELKSSECMCLVKVGWAGIDRVRIGFSALDTTSSFQCSSPSRTTCDATNAMRQAVVVKAS